MDRRTLLMGAGSLMLAGCRLTNSTGYVPTSYEIEQIQVGQDTRASLQSRFGSPTVIGESDDIWYYTSSQRSYIGPMPTREVSRRILAIRFNGDIVAGVTEFGQEIGQDVPISRYTTETGGRELSLWQQLRGNIGNFSAESFLQGL